MSLLRGADAETRALRHLQAQGLKLVARNWHCRGGELDLVMCEAETLVFVEVRSRGRSDYGSAFESITARKQAHLVLAAQKFIAAHPAHAARPMRFDAVAIEGDALEWLRDAFDAG